MSNRVIEFGRIPLIPDPLAALKAGAIVTEARAQTERVIQYMSDFFQPTTKLMSAMRHCTRALDRATYMRDLYVMHDRELAIRGVERDGIHKLFFRDHIDDHIEWPTNNRAGDNGR